MFKLTVRFVAPSVALVALPSTCERLLAQSKRSYDVQHGCD